MTPIDWSANPVAIITGGASGIGAASARALAKRGARVAVLDLDEEGGRAVAAEIAGTFVRIDVGSARDWERAVARIEADVGPIDLAHLNAGVMTSPPEAPLGSASDLGAISEAAYRRIVGVNVDGVFLGLHSILPGMTKRGRGRIVVTSSVAGLAGAPPDPLYSMTKHALVGLVRSTAPVLAPLGIGLAALCPGGVDTTLLPGFIRALGPKLLTVDEVARAVVALVEATGGHEVFLLRAGREAPEPFPAPTIDLV